MKKCNTKINFIQKDYVTALDKDTLKSALKGLASPEQTWPPAARIQKAKIEFSVTFFKVKTLTNQIRAMVPLSYPWLRVCVKTLIRSARIQSYRESKILDILKNGKKKYKLGK